MVVDVVIGSNYGDEGKGLTASALARKSGDRVLSVLFNGGAQRGHTVYNYMNNRCVVHTVGASDMVIPKVNVTYYHQEFMVDPIALALTQTSVYINPNCRVVLPCDIVGNQEDESSRGDGRHGSCGMGIYQCFKRSQDKDRVVYAKDLKSFGLYKKLLSISKTENQVYTIDSFMKAVDWVNRSCKVMTLEDTLEETKIEHVIYEGGQGLMLDMNNMKDFPHLTPSNTGSTNIFEEITGYCPLNNINIYYASRTYITRHGAGPMECECGVEEINKDIFDETNIPNEWQGSIRYGKLNIDSLAERIKNDSHVWKPGVKKHIVFTHANYTNDSVVCPDKTIPISALDLDKFGVDSICKSNNEIDFETVLSK